jgi:hypothetical protein
VYFDSGGIFQNDTFTVPVSGIYYLNAVYDPQWNVADKGIYFTIENIIGSPVLLPAEGVSQIPSPATNAAPTLTVSGIIYLTQGTKLFCIAVNTTGITQGFGYAIFQAYLMR